MRRQNAFEYAPWIQMANLDQKHSIIAYTTAKPIVQPPQKRNSPLGWSASAISYCAQKTRRSSSSHSRRWFCPSDQLRAHAPAIDQVKNAAASPPGQLMQVLPVCLYMRFNQTKFSKPTIQRHHQFIHRRRGAATLRKAPDAGRNRL